MKNYSSNFDLNVENISRGAGRSAANAMNCISGQVVHDSCTGTTYYRHRQVNTPENVEKEDVA